MNAEYNGKRQIEKRNKKGYRVESLYMYISRLKRACENKTMNELTNIVYKAK